MPTQYATVFNPITGQRKKVIAGDPNAFKGGFQLETKSNKFSTPITPNVPNAQPAETDYRTAYGLPALEQKATQRETDYQSAGSGQQAFIDALKKALLGGDTQTQGFQAEKERLIKQQYAQPTDERQRLIEAGIDNPFERQKRISEALGTTESALSAVSSRLAGLGKSREDLLQQGVKGYEADLATKDESRQAAANALKEAMGLVTKAQAEEKMNKQKQEEALLARQEKAQEAIQKRKEKLEDEARGYKQKIDFEKFKAGLKPKKGTSGGGSIITGGTKFTAQEKRKLEQAGLTDAPRQKQLDFIYGKGTETTPKPTTLGAYEPLKGQYEDAYLKWLAAQSTLQGMQLDPANPNVRKQWEASTQKKSSSNSSSSGIPSFEDLLNLP